MTLVLWQLAYSHFNEKVRWALELKGIAHERRSLLPGLHIPRAVRLSGRKQLPVLELDGRRIRDSTRIIAELEQRWPEPALYPADSELRARALALEDLCDEQLGPQLRCGWFYHLLREPDYAAAALTIGAPAAARRRYRRMFPVLRAAMTLDMQAFARRARSRWAHARATLDRVAAEIGSSGYLAGSAFSVADLTAAALMAPILPADAVLLRVDAPLPASLAEVRSELADHPAVVWAADIVRRHRPVTATG